MVAGRHTDDRVPFSLTDVYSADEAFVTGTFAGVIPVVDVDGHAKPAGPVTLRVRDLYRAARPDAPEAQLAWAEGILEVFRDPEWGAQAYGELAPEVADDALQRRLQLSRESRLGRSLMR